MAKVPGEPSLQPGLPATVRLCRFFATLAAQRCSMRSTSWPMTLARAFGRSKAYAAYRSYFPGPILIGLTSPPEAWGGHEYSVAEAVGTIKAAMEQGAEGAVVFAIGKPPPSHRSPATPSVGDIIAALIQTMRSGHTGSRPKLRVGRQDRSVSPRTLRLACPNQICDATFSKPMRRASVRTSRF